jgi:Flp pilus assembly protein TadD
VYAVALHSSGRRDKALIVLKRELARQPDNRDVLMALVSFSRDSGDFQNALAYATKLEQVAPTPELASLMHELRRQTTKPQLPRVGPQ